MLAHYSLVPRPIFLGLGTSRRISPEVKDGYVAINSLSSNHYTNNTGSWDRLIVSAIRIVNCVIKHALKLDYNTARVEK